MYTQEKTKQIVRPAWCDWIKKTPKIAGMPAMGKIISVASGFDRWREMRLLEIISRPRITT